MTSIAERRRRGGFSAVELMIIMVILGTGIVTLYGVFRTSSAEAFRSKWAYLASHAAREELETVRTLNLFGRRGRPAYDGHDWRRLEGSMFKDMASTDPGLTDTTLQYPPGYERIETRVRIDRSGETRVALVTVDVRYEQKGSSQYGFQTAGGNMMPVGVFKTLVVDRWSP